MRVLAISGSLRRDSHNSRLLRSAARALPAGAELHLFGGLRELPPYDEDQEQPLPAPVQALHRAIREADAVLVATPEYNASLPGVLKNALDWASRPFDQTPLRGKPVAVVGASTGLFGAVWAQAEARKVLETIGAAVLDAELPVGQADSAFAPDGTLADEGLAGALDAIVAQLVEAASEPVRAAA